MLLKFHLSQPQKSLHSFVRKRKAKKISMKTETFVKNYIEKRKAMHLWANMVFTEFTNRSMSYKESQQQIHVSDHTQTILGEKRKGSSKALMRRTNRIQGVTF